MKEKLSYIKVSKVIKIGKPIMTLTTTANLPKAISHTNSNNYMWKINQPKLNLEIFPDISVCSNCARTFIWKAEVSTASPSENYLTFKYNKPNSDCSYLSNCMICIFLCSVKLLLALKRGLKSKIRFNIEITENSKSSRYSRKSFGFLSFQITVSVVFVSIFRIYMQRPYLELLRREGPLVNKHLNAWLQGKQ